MEIRLFSLDDLGQVVQLWNNEATKYHYKPFTEQSFLETFIDHRYYDQACVFVAYEEEKLIGFAAGCTGDDLPLGDIAGYITTVIMMEQATSEQYYALIECLEARFIALGKRQADVLFFNPVKLKWSIPSSPNHEHNNAPGIVRNLPMYGHLLERGYIDRATQCGMYLPLGQFVVPASIVEKEQAAAKEGYLITFFDTNKHTGLEQLLTSLKNPQWQKDVAYYANQGVPLLIAEKNEQCVGFSGPIIREETGRAFFCGIGVHPEHEGYGLGTALFFRMVEAFQQANCDYISLFTGSNNPALKIYDKAGFKIEREFATMRKELQ